MKTPRFAFLSTLLFFPVTVLSHSSCSSYSWLGTQCDGCDAGHYRIVNTLTDECAHCTTGYRPSEHDYTYCLSWSSACSAGTYQSRDPSWIQDRACTTCPTGTFTSTSGQNTCQTKQNCLPGYFVSSEGSTSSDRACEACGASSFSTSTNSGSCQAWHTCVTNEYIDSDNPGSTTTDRECLTCPSGRESTSNNQVSCTDIDGCAGHTLCRSAGDSSATCNDMPAETTTFPHYTCTCSTGYHEQSGVCVNQDHCETDTCKGGGDTNAVCNDAEPDSGELFNCTCSSGYTEIGVECEDVDECATNVCAGFGDAASTCNKIDAPGSGNTCDCTSGYESVDSNGVMVCKNINSCATSPCADGGDDDAFCYDAAPPSTSYQCTCSAGFTFENGTCVEQNDCDVNRCIANGDSNAVCRDLAAPSIGNLCECSSGYESLFESNADNTTTCVNIDSCASDPCKSHGDQSAVCDDFAPPLDGYRCACSDGFEFDNVTCSNWDSCQENPCNANGDVNATCGDNFPGFNGTNNECNCSFGYVAQADDDTETCFDESLLSRGQEEVSTDDYDAMTLSLIIGGACLVFLVITTVVILMYRRSVKKKSDKMDAVLHKAETELSHIQATYEFSDIELDLDSGDMKCDIPTDGLSSDELREAQTRLEKEIAMLRDDNKKHKLRLEKHELENVSSQDVLVSHPSRTKPISFQEESDISMGDDAL